MNVNDLVRSTETCINGYFTHQAASFLVLFRDSLLQISKAQSDNEIREAIVETKLFLDTDGEIVYQRFMTSLAQPPETDQDSIQSLDISNLSLIDEASMENMMEIKSICKPYEQMFKSRYEAISRIRTRVADQGMSEELLDWLVRVTTPVDLLEILSDSLDKWSFMPIVRSCAMKAFDEQVIAPMDQLFGCIFQLYAGAGVLHDNENPLSGDFSWRSMMVNPEYLGFGRSRQLAAGGHAGGYSVSGLTSQVDSWTPQSAISSEQVSSGLGVQTEDALSRKLMSYLSGGGASWSLEQANANPKTFTPPSGVLRQTLKELTREEDFEKTDVDDVLSRISQEVNRKNESVSGIDQRVLAFVCELFRAVSRNDQLSAAVKAEILRLQIPMMRVALDDINVLSNPQHPAAQLVNVLAESGTGVGEGDEFLQEISKWVDFILEQYDQDQRVFEEAVDGLSKAWLENQEEVAERDMVNARLEAKRARMQASKQFVVNVLNAQIRGKRIPQECRSIVLKALAPTMLYRYMMDSDGVQWKKVLELSIKLLNIMDAGIDDVYFSRLYRHLPILMAEMHLQLQKGVLSEEKIVEYIENFRILADQRMSMINENGNVDDGYKTVEIDVSELRQELCLHIEEQSKQQEEQKKRVEELPEYVMEGRWFRLPINDEGKMRRLRLLSILPEVNELVFVDYAGMKQLVKTVDDFIAELDQGTAQWLKQDSVFDQALIETMNQLSVSQSL